jgi:hypothetical protein
MKLQSSTASMRRTLASPPPPIPIVFDDDEIKKGVMGDAEVGESAAKSARSMGINESEIEEEKQTVMDFDKREELESAPSIVYVHDEDDLPIHHHTKYRISRRSLHHGQPIDEGMRFLLLASQVPVVVGSLLLVSFRINNMIGW